MAIYAAARQSIADAIRGVPLAGQVHDRERVIVDWKAYLDKFVSEISGAHSYRGWWLTRERITVTNHAFGTINRVHAFVARGILAVQDSSDSDEAFGALVEDVMDAIDDALPTGVWDLGPCVARVLEPRQFGSVLCHYAEIEVPVAQEVST